MINLFLPLIFLLLFDHACQAFPDQVKWNLNVNQTQSIITVRQSLFNSSEIYVKIQCSSYPLNSLLIINWKLSQTICWENSENSDNFQFGPLNSTIISVIETNDIVQECHPQIILDEIKRNGSEDFPSKYSEIQTEPHKLGVPHPIYTIRNDGLYLFDIRISSKRGESFNASVQIEMQGVHGYLSASDWPLLPFYGGMCLIYVLLGLIWLGVSFAQWRDLLRIQFWIGGVILLGMLEKATFYAEYQNINSTGDSMKGAVLFAEIVSCGKRTLARMLVIIVSLGFGIVKPRLGPMLHRVLGVGLLYLILALTECYLRVMQSRTERSNQLLIAGIPLAVLDSAICWWIFTSLVQTTRTLRLRRNLVKLSLYKHFTNTLIFSVFSSVIFMLYAIKYHYLALCLKEWKEIWLDEAYWHILFSILLIVIMVLWRPTNNNQRYAFTPLLDEADEEDEELDQEYVNDAFGVKMRGLRSVSPKPKANNSLEEDLKWVEENIPSSLTESALPILDSDEEIMNTKFEVSKMQ